MSGTSATQATSRPRSSAAGTLLIVAITGAIILAVAYFSDARPAADATGDGSFTAVNVNGPASGAAPVVGVVAPDFTATSADGTAIRLSELQGKPVWLSFGASWCQPCRAENPDIQSTYEAVAGEVVVVQVYMDEDATAVLDYTSRVGITYLTVPDPYQQLAAQYRILGIPSHFFIDADGVLREIKVGSLDPVSMQAALARIGG